MGLQGKDLTFFTLTIGELFSERWGEYYWALEFTLQLMAAFQKAICRKFPDFSHYPCGCCLMYAIQHSISVWFHVLSVLTWCKSQGLCFSKTPQNGCINFVRIRTMMLASNGTAQQTQIVLEQNLDFLLHHFRYFSFKSGQKAEKAEQALKTDLKTLQRIFLHTCKQKVLLFPNWKVLFKIRVTLKCIYPRSHDTYYNCNCNAWDAHSALGWGYWWQMMRALCTQMRHRAQSERRFTLCFNLKLLTSKHFRGCKCFIFK